VPVRLLAAATTAGVLALCGCSSSSGAGTNPPFRHYHSRPDLRPPPVQILKRAHHTAPGYLFIAPKKDVDQAGPLILDNRGRVVWFRPLDTHAVTDFRVQRYRGRRVLTWWHGRPDEGGGESGYSIYDDRYRLVAHVEPGNGLLGDIHEFKLTPRDTALMTFIRQVRVKGRRVLEGGFQELDLRTHRVLFEWHSIDHVQLVESYYHLPRNTDGLYDYFHINSVDLDRGGNFLVSARNTHTIYEIDRRTGRIVWRLGGKRSDFTLGKDARFAWQHDARRLPNGNLSLFDNSAGPQVRKQSRGLILHLDLEQHAATVVRTFVHRPPLVSVDQGNLQHLQNGDFLAGWGHQPRFTEFGSRGTIRFDGRFGRGRVDSYRAYRFGWTGHPTRPPAVAVAGATLYVSWNGATEVRKWRLLGGVDRQSLRPLLTVPKMGFETAIPLRSTAAKWVAVQALDGRGRSLARSATVRAS
jgi:Arylsulfotransferase (ASST)